MAPLSKVLSGVILPHDRFGTHLDASSRTVDKDLERQNFKHAGEVLAEIWSSLVIDKHPVKAEYVEPGSEEELPSEPPAEWYSQHVRESQYFLQIAKCDDSSCCSPMRSDLKKILPDGFFPAPFPMRRGDKGFYVPKPEEVEETDSFPSLMVRLGSNLKPSGEGFPNLLPYDMYCPTVRNKILGRTCNQCGHYFASIKNATSHQQAMHKKAAAPAKLQVAKILTRRAHEVLCEVDPHELGWEDEDLIDDSLAFEPYALETEDTLPVINSVADWFSPLWTLDSV
ncbi:hypothetical protein FOCC_FOCC012394 [Frankliniella occidentalis]|nr:hypothetical protein FOCC_FOCC012394 [Frankliniella occidentalis]